MFKYSKHSFLFKKKRKSKSLQNINTLVNYHNINEHCFLDRLRVDYSPLVQVLPRHPFCLFYPAFLEYLVVLYTKKQKSNIKYLYFKKISIQIIKQSTKIIINCIYLGLDSK